MTTVSETRRVAGDLAPAADDLDGRAVTTIRMLALDAVQAAGSGHPGLPMGAAVPAWAVFSRFLQHDPSKPDWPDRDRFVLSAGHGSALLYALLHLSEDGGWAVCDPADPDVVLVAAGSEVALAVAAAEELRAGCGPAARVVSVPWRERFAVNEYRGALVPPDLPAVWIEAGTRTGWQALARPGDAVLGLDRFGASAPGPRVYAELGCTAQRVAEAARQVVASARHTPASGVPRRSG